MQRVLDHALDRREAGAAGDEDDRLVRVLAQVERAERPFEAQDLAPLELVEQLLGEEAARRRGGRAARAARRRAARVASEKLRRWPSFSRRSMYWPARNCSRSLAGSLSFTIATSGAGLSIDSIRHGSLRIRMSPARRTSLTSITRSVAGFAQQKSASPGGFLVVGQRRRLIGAVVDLALEDPALARAARAVAAAVRQHQVGGHRRREHGVVVGAGERVVAGLYGNLVRHDVARWNIEMHQRARQARKARAVIRVLLIGCGDVALRTADLLRPKVRLYGLTRRADDVPRLRAHGIVPIVGDLDRLATLGGCARRRSPSCISRRRRPKAATIRARRS